MPTTSATARRASALPPEQRRAAIVEATLPLLQEHGELVTTRQIAEAAGVAEGTIFRVFADKDELLVATLEAAIDMAPVEAALAEIDPALPFEDRLVTAVELLQKRVVDVWGLMSNLGPRLREAATRPLAASDSLTELLAAGETALSVDAPTAARMLRALTLSLTHPMLWGEPSSPEQIVDVFLNGVRR